MASYRLVFHISNLFWSQHDLNSLT